MLSCKEVAEHLTDKEDLSTWQRIQYPMHLFICKKCRIARDQYEKIEIILRKKFKSNQAPSKDEIEKLEKKIIENIHSQK